MEKLRLTPKQIFLLSVLAEVGPVESRDKLQLGMLLAERRAGVEVYRFHPWLDAPRSGELAQDVAFLRYQGLLRQDVLALTPLGVGILADARRQYDPEPAAKVAAELAELLPLSAEELRRLADQL